MRAPLYAVAATAVIALTGPATAGLIEIKVTIENLAPQYGTYQTPFWVGFHDGSFDLFDMGSPASAELERLAEDGNAGPLSAAFMASGAGLDGLVAPGGPFAPGDIATMNFTISSDSRYFSYASMVIPSNDAFIGNGDAMGHEIIGADGSFIGANFFITGMDVLDAGTEVNDEIPMNTAFFGQTMPDTGTPEGGVIGAHPGYLGSFGNPGGPASILADPMFVGADFTLPGYPIARIMITAVPTPGALALFGFAALGRRRRRV